MVNLFHDLKQQSYGLLAEEMQKICKPFLEKFNANYIDYARFYRDSTFTVLSTNPYYAHYFLNHDVYSLACPGRFLTSGLHLWDSYIDLNFLCKVSKQFQHALGLTIVTEQDNFKEVFNIATQPENRNMLNFYLNNQDKIQKFMRFFRIKANVLIQKSMDLPLILPQKKIILTPTSEQVSQHFYPVTINLNNIIIPLTNREAECLYYLNQGKTAKEIGKVLSISNRTVEIYLDQLRTKTNSKNRLELLGKLNRKEIEELGIKE